MTLPFDEITNLAKERLSLEYVEQAEAEEIEDTLLGLLIFAFVMGYGDTTSDISDKALETVNKEIDGETWKTRLREHIANEDIQGIYRLAETEIHRDYVSGTLDRAIDDGYKTKTWRTARDDRVRDTHDYLENMTVGIDDYFYTFDGDGAQAPSGFALAENNCNCRCYLDYGY